MNRILIRMLCLFALCATFTATAATIKVDGFTYTTSGSNAKVSAGPTSGDVVIPETVTDNGKTYTVTEVSNNAFKGADISSVSIPDKCTKLGNYSFQNCKSLVKVIFGESPTLKTVGSSAFSGCTSLDSITLPNTVTSLGISGFADCSSLTAFTIPDGVGLATGTPLKGCTSLKSITLGVKMMSFDQTSTCPDSPLEEINVVEGAKYLSSADGVLYSKDGKTLEAYPASKPLEIFTVPAAVTRVNTTFSGVKILKSVVFNDLVTNIAINSFQNCPVLESITVGAKISNIGRNCFKDSPKFKEIIVSPENSYYKFADWTLLDKEATIIYMRLPQAPGTSYIVPATVETIYDGAFGNNSALVSVELGEKVSSIGSRAFEGCNALTTCTLPKSVTAIGDYAFTKCKKLTGIVLPDSLAELGEGAFYYCSGLTSINIPEKITVIGESVFSCTSLTDIVIPDSVKEIGAEAFSSIYDLQTVLIGAGVTKIGAGAFFDDSEESQPAVTFKPVVPPALGTDAFNEGTLMLVPASSLDAYKAAPGYANMDVRAQADQEIFDVTLNSAGTLKDAVAENQLNGVKSLTVKGDIDGTDFAWINRMPLLADVNLEGVTIVKGGDKISTVANTLPSHAFKGNSKLKSVILPAALTEIADSALCAPDIEVGDQLLETVEIPSTVSRIGASAFEGRYSLKGVKLPASLKKMGASAFHYCESLVSVNIPGSLDTVPEYAFSGCAKLTDIKIEEGVKALEYMCFSCKNLEEIVLPNSIDSIGGAFMSCTNLRKVTLPSKLRKIASYSFGFCAALEEIDIPDGVTYIGQSAFTGNKKLRRVSLPESLEEMGNSVFALNESLERIDIPRYVAKLGESVCSRCTSLKVATFLYDYPVPGEPDLTPVDDSRLPSRVNGRNYMFQDCTSLEAVYIGSKVFFLGNQFLGNTPALKKVYCAAVTPPDMFDGESAFTSYSATLYVPKASIAAYKANKHWKYFTDVRPIEGEGSGIEDILGENVSKVKTTGGIITFTDADSVVNVTDISGKTIYAGQAKDLQVSPGMYIVTVDGDVLKLMAR